MPVASVAADPFAPFAVRMRSDGAAPRAIRGFEHCYRKLLAGGDGYLDEEDVRPVESLPDADAFDDRCAARGREVLDAVVTIKLNGGLGTSMGLEGAKSLIVVKQGRSFLDLTLDQVERQGGRLLLMNSFATDRDTTAALAPRREAFGDRLGSFLQHRVPKVLQLDLSPARWPDDPELEWCPPGHGAIYTALVETGLLRSLLARGARYAFVSNADNLGADVDERILGYFRDCGATLLMETADRTESDRKGGHLAAYPSGRLLLREAAQCPPEELDRFQDVARYRYFNTNNLWLDLPSLAVELARHDGLPELPLIRNAKPLDPRQSDSPPVFQLETAMGSALSVFPRTAAIRVPRSRFAPVKTTGDLLAVQSDAYVLDEARRIRLADGLREPPTIRLDDACYRKLDDLAVRFPAGPPSLRACRRLTIEGDVVFGAGIVCRDEVRIVNRSGRPLHLAAGTLLDGTLEA